MQIALRDELSLIWFFGQGATMFERSTLGGMLERAELFSVAHYCAMQVPVRDTIGRVIGHTCGIDAQPTAELRASHQHAPDDAALTRYAAVSRLVVAIARRDRDAATALENYYGELGARWARSEKPGRIAALYHLTTAGQKLLAESAREQKGGVSLAASLRMANEVAAKPTERRRAGLSAASRQASVLHERACGHWLDVKREHDQRRAA